MLIKLTEREREVIRWVALGLTNDKIAIKMMLSKHTIKVHLENIYYKLKVHNKVQMIIKAIQYNLINIEQINQYL